MQWRYRPTTLNGQPVEVDTFVTVVFTLNRSAVSRPAPRRGPERISQKWPNKYRDPYQPAFAQPQPDHNSRGNSRVVGPARCQVIACAAGIILKVCWHQMNLRRTDSHR